MASVPSYVEQQALPRQKSLIENLLDFSFERMMTPRMLKAADTLRQIAHTITTVPSGFAFGPR